MAKKTGNNMDALYKSYADNKSQDKFTNWKNEPKFDDLEKDRLNGSSANSILRENLLTYEEIRNGGKDIAKRPGKSVTRPKLVRKQNEYKYAALEDAIFGAKDLFSVEGVGEEDYASASQNQVMLNYQFRNKIQIQKLVEKAVRNAVDKGTVICKVGWKTEYGTAIVEEEEPVYANAQESIMIMQQKVANGEMTEAQMIAMLETGEPVQTGTRTVEVEKEKLIVNHPTIDVRNIANITIDPTCEGDLNKASFLIEEYPVSLSELKKEEYKEEELEEETTDENGNTITVTTKKKVGTYRNLDLITNEEEFQFTEHHGQTAHSSKLEGKSRRKLKAYDYWGFWDINDDGNVVPIVATWVGKVLVRLEENPYAHKKIPYVLAQYMPVDNEIFGEPDAVLLEENQEAVGKTTRAIQDIIANEAVGQEFIDESFFPSPVERENYRQGRTVFFRQGVDPKRAIYRKDITPPSSFSLQWIQNQIQDAESMSGTILSTTSGSNQSVNYQKRIDSSNSKRESSVLRRITAMFVDAAKLIIPMNAAYLSEEEVVRNTNKEYVKIRRDDLSGSHDITIDIQTPEVNNAIAQDLGMILQTGQQTLPPVVTMKIWSRILKLKGQYDLARQIEDFKPEQPAPDPRQVMLMDMQIEEQRLKIEKAKKDIEEVDSRIHERVSRVIENEKDVDNKQSQYELRKMQAMESEARTNKLKAETENLDKEFVDSMSGNKRAREIEDRKINYDIKRKEKEDDATIEMSKADMMNKINQLEQLLNYKQEKQITSRGE